MLQSFLASIFAMSFGFPPKGWALCNGQLLPINQNQALFSLLGTTYGGDGRVNFALPNLQGRVPIHQGNGFVLGQVAGQESHTLIYSEMPPHNHDFKVSTGVPTIGIPTNASSLAQGPVLGVGADASNILLYTNTPSGPGNALVTLHQSSVGNKGGSQPHTIMQPYSVLSYCIALQGIFPSQT
ncbi:phage tail protein [Mucilaginibacter sp. OK098]|uniref:phage tail protein n=1 Tax=Mucilaginibacter sp. OK098 TaxID=1855297 RepID=UPI000921253C|nr:tail fiber protein [Mucilaginibacter sp. OK098]SHN37845.1 Microcystin-dependent protein [Mucilaginibacter sp. OK098]